MSKILNPFSNKSGFKAIFNAFNTAESKAFGLFGFIFTELEIVRSEILKYIVKSPDI